jgi:hypothetical protein
MDILIENSFLWNIKLSDYFEKLLDEYILFIIVYY